MVSRRAVIDRAVNAGHHAACSFLQIAEDSLLAVNRDAILRRNLESALREPGRAAGFLSSE